MAEMKNKLPKYILRKNTKLQEIIIILLFIYIIYHLICHKYVKYNQHVYLYK